MTPEVAECDAAASHECVSISDGDLVPRLHQRQVAHLFIGESATLGDVVMCEALGPSTFTLPRQEPDDLGRECTEHLGDRVFHLQLTVNG